MKKKLLSLALALALCAGLTVPALAAEDAAYAPYSIAGIADDGGGYTVSFDAAKTERKYVDLRFRTILSFNGQWKSVFLPYTMMKVTQVTLEPGSGFDIFPDSGTENVHLPLVYDGYNHYTAGSDLLSEGFAKDLFGAERVAWDLNHYDGIRLEEEGETYLILYAPSGDPNFTDVMETTPYRDAIAWAAMKNITRGTSSSTFGPYDACTHNHFLTFLWRALGSPAAEGEGDFAKAVDWAGRKGLLSGGPFDGGAACTKREAMVYLWKLAGSPKVEADHSFIDVPAQADYLQAVSWAVRQGIASGTSFVTFGSEDVCARGEMMDFLYRAMK